MQKVESHYENLFEAVSSIINFANQAGTDFKQIERDARQTLESVKTYADGQKKQMENKMKGAESILESMRTASAEAGVSQNAIHYSNAQKGHSEQAQKWYRWGQNLLIGLIFPYSLLVYSLCFLKEKKPLSWVIWRLQF